MMSTEKLDRKYGSLIQNLSDGNVWLTEFEKGIKHSWEPSHWGADGFTKYDDADTFRKKSENGVLMVAFAKSGRSHKVVGIYQLSNKKIIDFHTLISTKAIRSLPDDEMQNWRYAFKAVRSWRPPSGVSLEVKKLFPLSYEDLNAEDVEAVMIDEEIPPDFFQLEWREESVYCRDGIGISRQLRRLCRILEPDFKPTF